MATLLPKSDRSETMLFEWILKREVIQILILIDKADIFSKKTYAY